jgi:hypothetical protein
MGEVTMHGEITKIITTADMGIKIYVEMDKDAAPSDIFTWLHKEVIIRSVDKLMEVVDDNR